MFFEPCPPPSFFFGRGGGVPWFQKLLTLLTFLTFCHGSMSYRQDFRRNIAPYTAAPAQEHASSETALPSCEKEVSTYTACPVGSIFTLVVLLSKQYTTPAYLVKIWSTPVEQAMSLSRSVDPADHAMSVADQDPPSSPVGVHQTRTPLEDRGGQQLVQWLSVQADHMAGSLQQNVRALMVRASS